MVGKGRCPVARSADAALDKSMIDRVMLSFRPIAPKPAGDGSPYGKSSSESINKIIACGRAKRKYVRVRKNNQCKSKKKPPEEQCKSGPYGAVVTLQLLPERSEGEDFSAGDLSCNPDLTSGRHMLENPLVWLNFKGYGCAALEPEAEAVAVPRRVTESWVISECVTDTCIDGGGLGFTDHDRIKNLEADTCPGFISDGFDVVTWVNGAYKKMLSRGDEEVEYFRVWLVVKERLPPYSSPGFACRVRLEYMWQERKHSRMVPCDVWRMDGGGFAWRLDVRAELSLGI